MFKLASSALLLSFFVSAFGAKVAIIDSGVDYEHGLLKPKMWMNKIDTTFDNRDQDGNGYEDDVYGWNFGENNSMVIDYKYLGTFSQDPYIFFGIQGRSFLGKQTEADIEWLKSKGLYREPGQQSDASDTACKVSLTDQEKEAQKEIDPEFMKEMQIFGNFVHGTHVAGIVAQQNPYAEIMAVKLLPTEVGPKLVQKFLRNKSIKLGLREKLIQGLLTFLATQQSRQFIEMGDYLKSHKMDVANGSFGMGFNQAKMIIKFIYPIIFFKKPNCEELTKYSRFFINKAAELATQMTERASDTLFVFAAGNDGLDNDTFGTSPANIRADNSITVAATLGNSKLASFSNYGKEYVDVAAPGVVIESSIPGDEYLQVSGTSQASPYVAKVAALIKDENPNLKPVEIKKILMGTVDKKSFLVKKVISEGVVNINRAKYAAKLSLKTDLKVAIEDSKLSVADISELDVQAPLGPLGFGASVGTSYLPMTPMYILK